jgi:hypothetical protein
VDEKEADPPIPFTEPLILTEKLQPIGQIQLFTAIMNWAPHWIAGPFELLLPITGSVDKTCSVIGLVSNPYSDVVFGTAV